MVTADGTVKILDFGLAKLAGAEGVTQTGTTVGTVAYMSPEQARGEEVDHRTDIWPLGVVFYEMLAGRLPFAGEHAQALIYAILNTSAALLTSARADVPADLARAVGRTLTKHQTDRYGSADDLLADLRAVKQDRERRVSPEGISDTLLPSIAVLPFADMSPQQD